VKKRIMSDYVTVSQDAQLMHLGRNLSSRVLIIYQEMISLRPQTMILGGGKVKHYVSSVLALHMRCPVGGLGDTHDTATYAEGGKGDVK
jgi:hypothetical protein